tara:strand:- start:44 stop:640 length:597 start_codon:yes stop_codon:yes gene_type:complete
MEIGHNEDATMYTNEFENNNSLSKTSKKGNQSKTDPLYETRILQDKINLLPKELNCTNLQDKIELILKNKVEGKCISDGYIKSNSVEIVSRNMGCMEIQNFSASVSYLIKYKAEVCSPKEGQILECTVHITTDTNCICHIGDEDTSPIEIYLFREHNLGNSVYSGLKEGDNINVKIANTQIEFGKGKILAIAAFLNKV